MITGDSPQCGAYIARECGMIAPDTKLMLGEFSSKEGVVMWAEMTACDESVRDPVSTADLLAKVSGVGRAAQAGQGCDACAHTQFFATQTHPSSARCGLGVWCPGTRRHWIGLQDAAARGAGRAPALQHPHICARQAGGQGAAQEGGVRRPP